MLTFHLLAALRDPSYQVSVFTDVKVHVPSGVLTDGNYANSDISKTILQNEVRMRGM